jgi:hypothetical protein
VRDIARQRDRERDKKDIRLTYENKNRESQRVRDGETERKRDRLDVQKERVK